MATTYEAIQTTTLGTAAAFIDFTSIAASWTDLRVVLVAKPTTTGDNALLRFNSDTASNYSNTNLIGNGSTASSGRSTSATSILLDYSGLNTTNPNLYEIDIFSYAGSTYKTVLVRTSEDNNGSGDTRSAVGLWRSTSAITSLRLYQGTYTFAAGTIATLYGILAA
tara:strand:- start:867 stop:1364 length:498 start_codon:yes stop_codon:yes gene_type:complete